MFFTLGVQKAIHFLTDFNVNHVNMLIIQALHAPLEFTLEKYLALFRRNKKIPYVCIDFHTFLDAVKVSHVTQTNVCA